MRIRLVSKVLAILGLCAAAGAADAQSGTIAGRVTQAESGAPIPSVQVAVYSGASIVGAPVQTGEDGSFRIANVPVGTYAVLATRIGFVARRTEGISVTAGATTTANLTLVAVAEQLNPVVSTSVRGVGGEKILESPNAISVVSADRIEERPAVTVTDHLKAQPGLSISNGGIAQANIVSRGFNNAFSTTMLMLQDYRFAGVPSLRVNVPFLFTGVGEDIDRIEVLQGPASALYGPNSGSGVLHVITKSPFQSQGTTLTLDGGERSLMRVGVRHAGTIGGEKWGYKVSGEYFTAKDWEYTDPNDTITIASVPTSGPLYVAHPQVPTSRVGQAKVRDHDLLRYSGEARLDYRPNDDMESITTFGYSKIGSAIEITTTFGPAQVIDWSYTNFQQRVRYRNTFAQVFYNASDAGNSSADDVGGTYYLRSGIPVVDQSSVLVAQLQQGLNFGETRLTGGVDYIATRPKTAGTIMGRNEEDDSINEVGAYLQTTHPLSEKVDFTGAVRADMNSRIEGTQFSPRAAIIYKASPTSNFRLTYNRAFNSPASFSWFLDQWSGRSANLGPLGNNPLEASTEIRIFGNPAKDGWHYDRGCVPAVSGGLCMRAGGAVAPAAAPVTLQGLMAGGLAAQIAAGWAATFGLNGTQQANLQAALAGLAPTPASYGTILRDLNIQPNSPALPISAAQDLSPLGANFSNTWEIGYKGLIGDRFRLSVDYWYQIRPAEPTVQLIPQVVFADPATLGAYLGAGGTGLTAAMAGNGIPAPAIGPTITALTTTLAGIPAGVLQMDNDLYDKTYLVYTYRNAVGQVDVRGVDIAMDYILSDAFTVEATYSNLNRNVIPTAPGATEANPLVANAPKHRATATVRYQNAMRSLSSEVRVRYYDAMDVNSGVYNNFGQGTPVPYERVPVNFFLDAGFSWRLPFGQNVRWALNGTNLLGSEVPSFIGVPAVGRLVTTRIQYSF